MFSLIKRADKIWELNFKQQEDLAYAFLRFQEFYESDNLDFKDKTWTIESYKEWYSDCKSIDGTFSYTRDWSGFNIPLKIITNVESCIIPDPNNWDSLMIAIKNIINDPQAYLIGTYGDAQALKHELAHALFYTNAEYKQKVEELYKCLTEDTVADINDGLRRFGYCEEVFVDEAQAYGVSGSILAYSNEEYSNFSEKVRELFDSTYKSI